MHYNPSIVWDPKVSSYFEHAFGVQQLHRISAALCQPSLRTCLRVNTANTTPQVVVQQLQQLFPGTLPLTHSTVSSVVIVPGKGPLQPNYDVCGGREIVINRLAAEAVLKGAHVYSPGLLAASPGIVEGDLVAVTVALEQRPGGWSGINRGMILTPELNSQLPSRDHLAVGIGRATAGRVGLFRQQQGLAIELTSRVFDIPSCNGVLRGQVLLQALPCVVAAQVLDPQPGSMVLDMCAAPGGKTTMLAQMMGDSGTLVALDRTLSKVQQVQDLAADWGVNSVNALRADATMLCQQQQQHDSTSMVWCNQQAEASGISSSSSSSSRKKQKRRSNNNAEPPYRGLSAEVAAAVTAASFDYVLLDAPCSALGLKPRLLMGWSLLALQKLAAYQKALLHSAVHCLKPGGKLVYCTCTINPGENEENVRYVLDRWPQMRLVEQPVVVGGPGLVGPGWLTAAEAQMVQRFDPVVQAEDTIGFFIAKFQKTASTM